MHAYIHTCIWIRAYMHAYIDTYIHTHTRMWCNSAMTTTREVASEAASKRESFKCKRLARKSDTPNASTRSQDRGRALQLSMRKPTTITAMPNDQKANERSESGRTIRERPTARTTTLLASGEEYISSTQCNQRGIRRILHGDRCVPFVVKPYFVVNSVPHFFHARELEANFNAITNTHPLSRIMSRNVCNLRCCVRRRSALLKEHTFPSLL